MKKWMCLFLAAVFCVCTMAALAEAKSKLEGVSGRLKKGIPSAQTPAVKLISDMEQAAAQTEASNTAPASASNNYGPEIRINNPEFTKVRSSAFLNETPYTKEANVMIELKNVSGQTLYPDSVSVIAYNASGKVVKEEIYSNYGPDMVEAGESLFVWDWFYNVPVADISYFEVKMTTETSSYYEHFPIAGEAYVSKGKAYALVKNTTDSPLFEIKTTIVMENANGVLLDVQEAESYFIGITPGSEMIARTNAMDYVNDGKLTEAKASAYVQYKVSPY